MSVPAMQLNSPITVADLLRGAALAPEIDVRGIATDSRKVRDGYLFLAVAGIGRHGLEFAADAVASGAIAVAWDSSTAAAPDDIGVPVIAVDNLADKLGEIANRFYGFPSTELQTIGVTGTNGKTTVAWLLAQALQQLDRKCAYLGTLGHGVNELQVGDGMTTPATVDTHEYLADFLAQGSTHAAIEVSSHALAQKRVDGVVFDAVMFTNLSREHLDYHGDMQRYFDAKASLFIDYESNARFVNVDSSFGTELATRCGQHVTAVSTQCGRVADGRPYLFARSIVATAEGSDVTFASTWGSGEFSVRIPGDYNVANALLVLAYLLHKGVDLVQACEVMSLLQAPPGRMQRVAVAAPAIFIDYAHTPDALASALRVLQQHCRGKILCVFGCGGERDAGKRPEMGRVAEQLADTVVVTNDNPRAEDASAIIRDIVSGFSRAESAVVIEDRGAAIAWAVANATSQDAILIAGKGHEEYQEIAGEKRPFSDLAVAARAATAQGAAND